MENWIFFFCNCRNILVAKLQNKGKETYIAIRPNVSSYKEASGTPSVLNTLTNMSRALTT